MRSLVKRALPVLLLPALLAGTPAHAMRCAALPADQLVAQSDFVGIVEVVEAKSGNPKGGRKADGKIHFKALVRELLKGDVAVGKLIRFTTASHYNAPAGAAYAYRVEDKPLVLLTRGQDGTLEAARCMNWTLVPEQGEAAEVQIEAVRSAAGAGKGP